MGLEFPNRLGLAAGFDKNAIGIDALAALGFGFVEVGTVTARPQPGNPQPRLFRLTEDRAIVNRMGFNNDGAEAVAERLARRAERLDRRDRRLAGRIGQRPRRRPVLGINIGKTKVVPEDDEQAVLADYAFSARLLAPYADYLVVNVSLAQHPGAAQPAGGRAAGAPPRARYDGWPTRRRAATCRCCVKIAPDLADEDVVAVAELARGHGLDGIIATNTTISREGLRTDAAGVAALGAGGLSGPVLAQALSGGAADAARPRPADRDHLGRRDHQRRRRARPDPTPAPTSSRPTPPSSTAGRCGRVGSPPH